MTGTLAKIVVTISYLSVPSRANTDSTFTVYTNVLVYSVSDDKLQYDKS